MTLTDTHLFNQIKAGNETAFEAAFREYYQALCNFARKYMDDMAMAEEVVQEVFYKVWEKRDSIEVNTSLKSYLYRAVRNSCLNHIKHEKVVLAHQQHETVQQQDQGSRFDDPLETFELEAKIQASIAALPEQCQKIFRMSRFEELKYQEIADKLGLSVKTIEVQMGKALKSLRLSLKDYLAIGWMILWWW